MSKAGTISFWSADAFLTLTSTNCYKSLTPELISRLSAFVDAYILFDQVLLPERYTKYSEFEDLGGVEAFSFIPKSKLAHSTDLAEGMTFDIDMISSAYSKLTREEKYWAIQHDPEWFTQVYREAPEVLEGKFMQSKMRLWHWCLAREISNEFNATSLLPNSLAGITNYEHNPDHNIDHIKDLFDQFVANRQERLVSASRNIDDPYIDTVKNYPPFLACLFDRAGNREQLIDVLKIMRVEYAQLRELRETYVSSIANATSVGEKLDITESWSKAWEQLLKSDFKRVGLLSKKISASDSIKMIFAPDNYTQILKFLAQQTLDFSEQATRTKQFRIFCEISADAESIYFDGSDMYKKFGIEGIFNM